MDFDALETTVIGRWERKGQFGIDDAEPSFREITVEMKVISKQPIERVAEVARLTQKMPFTYDTCESDKGDRQTSN